MAAGPLEALLRQVMMQMAHPSSPEPLDLIMRAEVHSTSLHLLLPIRNLPAVRSRLVEGEHVEPDQVDSSRMRLVLPVRVRFHGGRMTIATGARPTGTPDATLVRALRAAHAMIARDEGGRPVLDAAPETPYRRRLVRLAFLAPELQQAVLAGRQPPELTLARLMDASLPLLWSEQASSLGLAALG